MEPARIDNDPPRSRLLPAGICLLLAVMVWMVFGQTLGHDFVGIDDDKYAYDNPQVAGGLTLHGIEWGFTHTQVGHWVPLVMISHMLDCQLYGLKPGGHHLTNVLLHATAVILLFLVLRQMTGALWRSAFVAAFFAIHPLRAESVAWVSERKDVLSGVFFMLIIAAYTHYARKPSLSRYMMAVALFALGLMAKSMLVTLPFILLLLDYWPLGRSQNIRHLFFEKVPFFVLSATACVIQILSDKELIVNAEKLSLMARVGNALVSYAVYLGEMVYPAGLSILYPHPANNLPVWEVALAVALLAAITYGVILRRSGQPWLLVGWLWYLGMLVPVIGLIQSGWQAHADRYTYLPQIGLYIAITWLAADLASRWPSLRAALCASGMIAIGALMYRASIQVSYWRDDESLWTRVLALAPNNAVAENGLGATLVRNGRVDEGVAHYLNALRINPTSSEANYNLGIILQQRGQLDEAIAHYQRSLDAEPDFAEAHSHLGSALQEHGLLDGAIAQYQLALQIDSDSAGDYNNLGYALQLKGQVDEAIVQYKKALEITPNRVETRLNLGIAFHQKGEMNEALGQFQKAVDTNPRNAKAQNDLGLALLQSGNVDEAIAHFQKALEIEPGYGDARSNLNLALRQKRGG